VLPVKLRWCLWAAALLGALALASPARAQQVPYDDLIWGFCQVCSGQWPLSDEELRTIVADLKINTIRLFVPPQWIGIPQKTWAGPESIDYTKFAPEQLVWRRDTPQIDSLDEVLDQLYRLNIHPVLMVWPVDEYVNYLHKDDLTFLSNPANVYLGQPNPLDYTGIRPVEQVKALSVAVARHVHEKYGDDFTIIYTEICGSGKEGTSLRGAEQAKWREVIAAVKAAAPGCQVYSPELCISMWWWPTALKYGGQVVGKEVVYGDDWPRGDRIENYAEAFDALAISYIENDRSEWLKWAPSLPHVRAAADVVTGIVRDHCQPQKWLWAEAPWARHDDLTTFHESWAMLFLGADHCRGMLSWQLKDAEGSPAGALLADGSRAPTYPLLQAFAAVAARNARFLGSYHERLNADGFPVADDQFVETDPWVLTRHLERDVVLFNAGPVRTGVTFSHTSNMTLQLVTPEAWPNKVTVTKVGDRVKLEGLLPQRLYLFQVVPAQ